MPPGLFAYGAELAAAVDCRLGRVLVGDGVHWIDAPRRLGRADVPSEPLPWGAGALCVDLGPDDGETWERFVEVHRNEDDPEAVAASAQQWRLAVTPYRRPLAVSDRRRAELPGDPPSAAARVEGARFVDLTSMWAGPLCTELLGTAGAEVVKVESAARPDGLAGSAMYHELNAHKTVVDLDLRNPSERGRLDAMLESADLLVTSLSPRALANLELLPAQLGAAHPHVRTLAITAFEPGSPEADWVAYGTGVHAASGLGWLDESPQAPTYSYPDPLAGLQAACSALDQLAGAAPRHTRVSLAGAVAPLASRAACSRDSVASASAAGSGGDRHG